MTRLGILVVALVVLVAHVHAQDFDAIKSRHSYHQNEELWLNLGNAAVRSCDAATTRHMLTTGAGREAILPSAIVNHDASMWAFSATVVGVQYFVSHQLRHHNHRTLANVILATDIVTDGYACGHNMTLKKPPTLTPIIINVPVKSP